jgi:tetratricopeptide (TPR) repeat protein
VFQAAWCLERAGRTEDAAKYYAEVVESSTEPGLLAEAYFRLAWLALEGREMEAAASRLDSAIALAEAHGLASPTIEHARYWSAVCVETEGRLLDAAIRYQPIIEEGNPDLWLEAAYRRLLCLSQVGDLDGALAAAEILLQPAANARDPDRLRALQALAREEQWQIERARAFA